MKHERTIGKSQTHLTPQWILEPLGAFDLDPCASDPRPWDIALVNFTEADNGLLQDWFGRVFLNPPYDRRIIGSFVDKMVHHGIGTALVHARTDTQWFKPIFESASALLFLTGRVSFCRPDGTLQLMKSGKQGNSGAPVVLAAFGYDDADILALCGLDGAFVPLRIPRAMLAATVMPSWRMAVDQFMREKSGPVSLAEIYRAFAGHAKTKNNPHWREKLRQTMQRGGFERIAPGIYAGAQA